MCNAALRLPSVRNATLSLLSVLNATLSLLSVLNATLSLLSVLNAALSTSQMTSINDTLSAPRSCDKRRVYSMQMKATEITKM